MTKFHAIPLEKEKPALCGAGFSICLGSAWRSTVDLDVTGVTASLSIFEDVEIGTVGQC
jgi:hypothetical protein